MEKKGFLDMILADQVVYYNTGMQQGQSMGKISEKLGISKGIAHKFKRYGYVLKKNQYVLQAHIKPVEPLLNGKYVEVPVPIPDPVIEELEPHIPTNISLNARLKKKLQIYGINNDITLSDILNRAGEAFLKKGDD